MLGYVAALVIAIMLAAPAVLAGDCNETVMIDSVEYAVGTRWCGKRLNPSDVADVTQLVRIPDEYCFDDYRIYVDPQAQETFVRMAEAAKGEGIGLIVDSGYRSAAYQGKIISRRLHVGETFERITRFVAPPGYSRHETGRAIDMVPSDAGFAHTDTYRWLKENAGRFNFVETYPRDTTGLIPWEPWHWEYQPAAD